MSLAAALNTSVAGLQAQATGLGIVSDNIANSSTVGYKATSAQFSSLVTAPPTANSYTPGGVLPKPFTHVELQGNLQSSTSNTDIAIIGNGFFPVTNAVSSISGTATGAIGYSRAGSFTLDKSGFLVNSAGQYVMGFDYDAATNAGSLATAKAIGLGNVTGDAKGTTALSLGATLNSNASVNTPISFYGSFPAAGAAAQTFSAVLYSSTGVPYKVDMSLARAAGAPSAALTVTSVTGLTPTAPALKAAPALPLTIANISQNNLGVFSASPTGSTLSFADNSTLLPSKIDASGMVSTGGQAIGMAVDEEDFPVTIYDSLGVALNLTMGFSRSQTVLAAVPPATNPTVDPAHQRDWSMFVKSVGVAKNNAKAVSEIANGAGGAASVGFPVNMDGSNFRGAIGAVPPLAGAGSAVSFNSDGTLGGAPPSTFPAMTLITGARPLGGSNFTLNLGTVNSKSGLSSFQTTSGNIEISQYNQDGIAYGNRTGVAIDKDGIVSATFSNGQSTKLYRIPLATFANPSALTPVSGNMYFASEASGDAILNFPGQGTAGKLTPGALESSTVDLSTEFTNMIVIQRNYSANTKSISAADGMMQDLLNVIR
ncbi:MAG: flagellar hook-basal body complex protein [Alphaproteobacteria bacterium]|nr:flagellar hook-basal body complex protein [Alphaproteobacteria bacterium]